MSSVPLPLVTPEYSVYEWKLDYEGFKWIKVEFTPGVDDASIMWKLAQELFGDQKWRVTVEGHKRDVELYGDHYYDRIGAWFKFYEIEADR